MIKPNCRDCLFCKINRPKRFLFCKQGHWWNSAKHQKRLLKLKATEAVTLEIDPRKIFSQANECVSFTSMDD